MLGNQTAGTNLCSRQVFSTHHLPAADQFEAWRQHLANIIDLQPADEPVDAFLARETRWEIGNLTFTQAVFSKAPERSWHHLPQSCLDHWCLVLARPEQSPLDSVLSFRSLALPFEGCGKDDEVLTLLLPRAALPQLDRNLGSANPDINPAMRGLLADYLIGLARNLSFLNKEQAGALAAPTAALVAACVTPTLERIEAAAAPLSAPLIERVTRAVRQNMASPDFGPDQLCRLMAMSRSKLYRLFEESGGVASFIQRERLREALARLEDQEELRSINQIAAEVGFYDHSTFSRAFRREFGFSPTEARERALVVPSVCPPTAKRARMALPQRP